MRTITEVQDVTIADLDGELGFEVELMRDRNGIVSFQISTSHLCELIEAAAYHGQKVGRDYEFTLAAAISGGAERARREAGR